MAIMDTARGWRAPGAAGSSAGPAWAGAATALVVVGVSLLVLAGWWLGFPALVQLRPELVPMQHNTALGLLLLGAGLLAATWRRPLVAATTGGLAAGLGGLTGLQDLLGTSFGLDELFLEHAITVKSAHPGRMSPWTAICMVLAGLALVASVGAARRAPRRWVMAALGATVSGIGFGTCLGYAGGRETPYGWEHLTSMALHTAAAFGVLGIGLLAMAWRDESPGAGRAPRWLGVPVGIVILVLAIGMSQALAAREGDVLEELVGEEVTNLVLDVGERVDSHLRALWRMAERWERRDEVVRGAWEADAENHLRDHAGYVALAWMEAGGELRWLVPGGQEVLAMLGGDAERTAAGIVESARRFRDAAVSPPVSLGGGRRGFIVAGPLIRQDGAGGALLGLIDVTALLERPLAEVRSRGYGVELVDVREDGGRGEVLLSSGDDDSRANGRSLRLSRTGVDWWIEVWPTAAVVERIESTIPELTLVMGVLLALLGGGTVRLAQRSADLAREARAGNLLLSEEILERRRAEAELRSLADHLEERVRERTGELEASRARALELADRARISEERFDLAARGANDGLWDWPDVDAEENWWSDRFYEMLGYAPGEIDASRSTFDELLHPADRQRTRAAIRSHFAEGVPYDVEYRLRTRSGEYRWFRGHGQALWDDDGRPQRMSGSIVDVHDRKLAEEEVRRLNSELEARVAERTRELESTNRELEAFTYSASHDLRAPLRHLIGFVSLLERSEGERLDEKGRRYLEIIAGSAARMNQLIDDLLGFSRTGRTEMETSSVDLGVLTDEVLGELEPLTDDRRVTIERDELPVILGDRVLLRTVMTNLVENALKFTRPRESAHIEIRHREGAGGEEVVFVRDNGVGFDMRYVDKLFGVFRRLHHENEFEGTGIGLANVRRIVHRHGGRTWAEGEVDGGATFYFALPTAGVGAGGDPGEARPASGGSGR